MITSKLSFRIHNTKLYEKNDFVYRTIGKLVGPSNYKTFTINSKICKTNHNLKYKTFYIHFKKFTLTDDNSHFINKLINGEIVNIMYSYPLYWRCSIIKNPTYN